MDCVVVAVRKHGVLMRFEVEAGGASFPPPATPAAILAADDACTIGWDDKEEREGGWPGMWREVGDATPDKKSTNSNSTVLSPCRPAVFHDPSPSILAAPATLPLVCLRFLTIPLYLPPPLLKFPLPSVPSSPLPRSSSLR